MAVCWKLLRAFGPSYWKGTIQRIGQSAGKLKDLTPQRPHAETKLQVLIQSTSEPFQILYTYQEEISCFSTQNMLFKRILALSYFNLNYSQSRGFSSLPETLPQYSERSESLTNTLSIGSVLLYKRRLQRKGKGYFSIVFQFVSFLEG